MAGRKLQLTLAIIKPDAIAQPQVSQEIKEIILKNGFYFIGSRQEHLPRQRAEQFYAEHHGKFFFNRLVSYMSSGPISSHILARQDGIATWRKLMGPTKVFKTVYSEPDSIRGRFGLTDTRNSTHGSDSETTAQREIKFFFPEFDIDDWYKNKEIYFNNGNVRYNEESCTHLPILSDS